jgi:hypothetical protein
MKGANPMSTEKQQIQDGVNLAQAVERTELERRLTVVEKSLGSSDLPSRLDSLEKRTDNLGGKHLQVFSIVFASLSGLITFAAIAVAFLAWGLKSDADKRIQDAKADVQQAIQATKSDAQQATRDMQSQVNQAVTNMNSQIQAFLGESMKKPELKIFTLGGIPLDQRVFEFQNSGGIPELAVIFLKNVGKRSSGDHKLRLLVPPGVSVFGSWSQSQTMETNMVSFYDIMGGGGHIAPTEEQPVDNSQATYYLMPPLTNAICRLQVLYDGAEVPAEAKFEIRLRK